MFLKAVHFDGSLGFALSDGEEKPISDGSEDIQAELGMGSQGCYNCYRYLRRVTVNSKRRAKSR